MSSGEVVQFCFCCRVRSSEKGNAESQKGRIFQDYIMERQSKHTLASAGPPRRWHSPTANSVNLTHGRFYYITALHKNVIWVVWRCVCPGGADAKHVCVCVAHSPFVHKIIKSSPRVHLLQIEAPRRWAARCAPRGSNFTSDRWIRVSTAAARDAATPPPIVLTLDLLTAPAVPKAGSEAPGGAFGLAEGVRLNIIKSL